MTFWLIYLKNIKLGKYAIHSYTISILQFITSAMLVKEKAKVYN